MLINTAPGGLILNSMKKQIFRLSFLLWSVASVAQNSEGPVSRHLFNSGKSDWEKQHYPAKVVGAIPAEDRFGNPGHACFLHGTYQSYINLGSNASLKPAEGTISIWLKMDNVALSGEGYEATPIVLTKSHSGDDFFEAYSIVYQWASHRLVMTSSLSEKLQVSMHSTKTIELGKWHHLVMTYDDEFVCMYLDGELQGRVAKNFRTKFLLTDSVMIGNSANTKNRRFLNGTVDDIEIYNRVLGPMEVGELYNAPDPNMFHAAMKWIFIIVLSGAGVTAIVALFTFRYKRELKKEKEKSRLQKQMHDMELQMLKVQMNPHFIFNAMNSVQQFILEGDNENASKYLCKFSGLLRAILESNKEECISLENEIDMLSRYIQIEALRFNEAFNYEIVTDARVLASQVKIPPMLIQPVVENAIWHGLLPKKDSRSLSIRFESIGKKLVSCTIDDNGVGRCAKKAKACLAKKKSLAISFIYERLQLMKQEWGGDYSFRITDKTDENGNSAGTRVVIVMPVMN
jgi:hypothetical protein